jgi:hypothetical protein
MQHERKAHQMRSVCITVLVFALLAVSPISYSQISDSTGSQVITVRLLPIADDAQRMKLWNFLEKIAQPETLEIPENSSIVDALRARCGSAPLDMQNFLAKLNPGMRDRSDEERVLAFIPCPYWAFPSSSKAMTKIPIQKGQSIDKVLPLYMGTAGKKTRARVIASNQHLLDASGTAKNDGDILIAYMTKPLSFILRDGIAEDRNQIIDQLRAMCPESIPTDELYEKNIADAAQIYRLVAQDGPQGETDEDNELICTGLRRADDWPFDMRLIEERYQRTQQKLRPLVLVADTGLDLSNLMNTQILWTNPYIDSPFPGEHGTNVAANAPNKDIAPSPDYNLAFHGTAVVNILSGGSAASTRLIEKFQIAVAKVTQEREPSIIFPSAVSESFVYANNIAANVLNMSVVVGAETQSIIEGLKTAAFLVVVAAGNNYVTVERARVFPPGLSEPRDRLIVVGAHDGAEPPRRADFSNFGQSVDLLAPGCAIPVRGQDGITRFHSGTSFAAPFVAFTAALLRSFGMHPDTIKSRILATVVFDENLIGEVNSAGRLDIADAISINDDILYVRDDSEKIVRRYGELKPDQHWSCDGSPDKVYSPSTVGRVVPHYQVVPGGTRVARVWARPSNRGSRLGALVPPTDCAFLSQKVEFRQEGAAPGSGYTPYEWSKVVSISPKLPRQ